MMSKFGLVSKSVKVQVLFNGVCELATLGGGASTILGANSGSGPRAHPKVYKSTPVYDAVPHKRVIRKLKAYGIQGNLLNWLGEFLSG